MRETNHTRCRHLKLSGHRCATPALSNEPFCYYHTCHRTLRKGRLPRYSAGHFPALPPLEDPASIQAAIHNVLDRLASGSIYPKEASAYLYGIQIAASLLRLPQPDPAATPAEPHATHAVEDINYGLIAAPDLEPDQPAEPAPDAEPELQPTHSTASVSAQDTPSPTTTPTPTANPTPNPPAPLQIPDTFNRLLRPNPQGNQNANDPFQLP